MLDEGWRVMWPHPPPQLRFVDVLHKPKHQLSFAQRSPNPKPAPASTALRSSTANPQACLGATAIPNQLRLKAIADPNQLPGLHPKAKEKTRRNKRTKSAPPPKSTILHPPPQPTILLQVVLWGLLHLPPPVAAAKRAHSSTSKKKSGSNKSNWFKCWYFVMAHAWHIKWPGEHTCKVDSTIAQHSR